MDFSWTDDQERLFAGALEFARGRLSPPADADPRSRWRLCGEGGFLGLCLPEEYGGLGLDLLTTARVVEALGQGCRDTGIAFAAAAHLFACAQPIAEFGSAQLRRELLPGLCSGGLVGANAASEPEAGSDVLAMRTRAVRDDDGYTINGSKSYVTNGAEADVILVYAVTRPEHGYLGLSVFAVASDSPGLVVGPSMAKTGLRAASLVSMHFEDCRVPAERMLGAEGQGAVIFAASMRSERSGLFAAYLGVMQRQLEQVIAHARERRQFGRPIGSNQAVSHTIVDMKLRLEASRLLLYHACWLAGRSRDAELAISLSKLAVSEAAVQSALDAIRINGGAGVMSDTGIDRALHDALPATIFSGTSDIQRNIIAGKLGL